MQTAERVSGSDASDNFVFRRSLLAYREAAELIGGDVLEIGTGSGYGVDIIAPRATSFVSIDKVPTGTPKKGEQAHNNVVYLHTKVPPLPFPDASFDAVVSFQVIEHVRRDSVLVAEIYRVLRPGGRLIISTPNSEMSLTRNPWHVREYTIEEFAQLLRKQFGSVEQLGVFGRENVMRYYENNRRSVARVLRWDIFRLNKWLPRWVLKAPYDVMNRINRRRLLNADTDLTAGITTEDYFLAPAKDGCFDLFYIAKKIVANSNAAQARSVSPRQK